MQILANIKYYKLNTVILVFLMFLGLTSFMLTTAFVNTTEYNSKQFVLGTYTGNYVVNKGIEDEELIISNKLINKIMDIDHVKNVSRRILVPVTLENDISSPTVTMVAVEKPGSDLLCENFDINSTTFFGQKDLIAVNYEVAEENDVYKDDTVELRYGTTTAKATVYNTCQPKYTNAVIDTWCIVNYDMALKLMEKETGYATSLLIYTDEESDEVRSQIEDVLNGCGKLNNWEETSAKNLMVAPVIWRILLYIMMIFLFLLICLGCSALIVSSLLGRTKDIGVYKTLGWNTMRVTWLYMGEILLLFIIAGIISMAASISICIYINSLNLQSDLLAFTFVLGSRYLKLLLDWRVFIIPSLICAVCCLMVVYIPIYRITRNNIINIINGVTDRG